MTDIIKQDPLFRMFSWPRLIDEFEDFGHTRGLRIHDTETDIIAEAVVAGVAVDNVDVHIEDGVVTVKAEQKDENRQYKYFHTAALSGGQWDKATATVKDGVVVIKIPKTESVKPRKIKVTTDN